MTYSTSSVLRSPNCIIKEWPNLTLYGDLNMRPFRNIWMLEEIGLPYKHVPCKPWSKVSKSVHPLGKVPALLVEWANDDNEKLKLVLLESASINTFLGDVTNRITDAQRNLPALVPPPATLLRAKYDSLALFTMTELDSQSLWIHRKHSALANVFGEAPAAVKEARRQFDNALDAMIDEITGNENDASNNEEGFLLPTGFSAVDILFAHTCFWAQQIGWLESERSATKNDSEKNSPKPLPPKLEAYLKQCRSRPAFARASQLRESQAGGEKKRPKRSKL